MATIRSITVGLPVGDLNEGIAWYRRLIGPAEEAEPAPGVWECLVTPAAWLQLFEQPADRPNTSVIRFEAVSIQDSHDIAAGLGSDVGEIETVPGVVRYFDFRDPYGNQLSFYELLD